MPFYISFGLYRYQTVYHFIPKIAGFAIILGDNVENSHVIREPCEVHQAFIQWWHGMVRIKKHTVVVY